MTDATQCRAGLSLKAINGVCRRKIQDWLDSITDRELAKWLQDKVVVAGGSLASMLTGQRVNDFDVYFTERDAAVRVAYHYLKAYADNPPAKLHAAGYTMWVDVVTPEHLRADDGEVCGTGDVVGVDDKGVMRLRRRGHDEAAFVKGPRCPVSADNQTWDTPGRVRAVIRSAGVIDTQEDGGFSHQCFESRPQTDAETRAVPDTDASALAAHFQDLEDSQASLAEDAAALASELESEALPAKKTGPGVAAANKYRPVFISSNAITLSGGIQLVLRFYGAPETILKNFDFVHTTCYWESATGKAVVNEAALLSMMCRQLHYVGSLYPLCALIRTRKFVARGWTAPASVFLLASQQCCRLDWNKLSTWEDQLVGVDTAYYQQLLDQLARDKADGMHVDATYVVALVERMERQ